MISNLSVQALVFSPFLYLHLCLSYPHFHPLTHLLFYQNAQMNTASTSLLLLIINQLIHHMLSRDMFIVYFFPLQIWIFYECFSIYNYVLLSQSSKLPSMVQNNFFCVYVQNFIWIHTRKYSMFFVAIYATHILLLF